MVILIYLEFFCYKKTVYTLLNLLPKVALKVVTSNLADIADMFNFKGDKR